MDIFKENPNLDVAYSTADGNYFATKNSAENHAKTLKDKKVKKQIRPDAKTVNVEETDDLKQIGEKADGTPVVGSKTDEVIENSLTNNKQPQNVDSGANTNSTSNDDSIETSAGEMNQAISDYMAKFGEKPGVQHDLKKIQWAIKFNKKLS